MSSLTTLHKQTKAELKIYRDDLWDRFLSGEDSLYNELLLSYMPLVETTAKTLKSSLPHHVELDDLISDGFIGLMEAVRRFDNSQGYKFETYASLRVRGEIIDKLRMNDWAPRSLRLKSREIEKAIDFLTGSLQRDPTLEEIADLLGWTVEDIHKVRSSTSNASFIDIDDQVTVDGFALSLSEVIADLKVPVDDLDYEHLLERLLGALQELSDQDRAILALLYIKDVSLTELAEMFTITETRAAQMHAQALAALRDLCVPA